MAKQSQISAVVSATTKDKLDEFTESRGLKKSYVVEQALLLFMDSRRQLPDEAFIPSRLVLSDESFDRVVRQLEEPPAPSRDLQGLMRGKGR